VRKAKALRGALSLRFSHQQKPNQTTLFIENIFTIEGFEPQTGSCNQHASHKKRPRHFFTIL